MVVLHLLALCPVFALGLREAHHVTADVEADIESKTCPGGLHLDDDDMCSTGTINFTLHGTINAQALFTEELARAIEDPELLAPLMGEVAGIWDSHEETATELIKEYMHALHDIEKALPTTVFVAEHSLEHFLIHGIAHTFHFAAHSLSHGGNAAAEVFAALSVGTEALGSALGSPFLFSMQVLLLYVQITTKKLDAWGKTASIANAIVQKSNCLNERFHWTKFDVVDSRGMAQKGLFKEEIQGLCGKTTLGELAKESLEATKQLQKMFSQMASVGRCLYPAKYKSEKVTCIEAVIPNLRMSHGEVGLFHAALSLANAFATSTDALLVRKHFGSYLDNLFNLNFPSAPDVIGEVTKVAKESPPMKAVSCVALVASQRAYAKSFAHLAEAIPTWFQTFAREMFKPGFSSSWHPCSKIFNPMEDSSTCNQEHYSFPEDRMGMPACNVAYNSHIWESSPEH
mmetsp:Transcript_54386/g.126932  ORF Transcript_54386/g.126932 Transcript_54386/m.126932 type:complete len:458 (-) Transcript_54386:54-1427(-)